MGNLRRYGKAPFNAVVLHGGPGAAGEMSPVARELSGTFGVLEPLQTRSTINGLLGELKDTLEKHASPPVILCGYSWGAWLGCIFAARNPGLVKKLILVSSGPFEEKYAADIMKTRLGRLDKKQRALALSFLSSMEKGSGKKRARALEGFGRLMSKADSYSALKSAAVKINPKPGIYRKIWKEASLMRSSGELLAICGKIRCPVTAIHGDYDPHPAEGVRIPLSRALRDFKFVTIKKCGHTPWMEKPAAKKFYKVLIKEMEGRS